MGLLLQALEITEPLRWRWLLTDGDTSQPLADHPVDLDSRSDGFRAFTDLYRYLRWNAAPDRRAASEAEIVARVGAWAGREVLGKRVGDAIVNAARVTVRVSVPESLQPVYMWPLELAHPGGAPLAARGDITLIYDVAPPSATRGRPAAGEAAADAGGVQLADRDERARPAPGTVRADPHGPPPRHARAAAGGAAGRPVRGDPRPARRDRRRR